MSMASKSIRYLKRIRFDLKVPQNPKRSSEFSSRYMLVSLFSSKSYRKRVNKRNLAAFKPTLDEFKFHRAVSQLLPRFKPEELDNLINVQEDPLVCLELFNWASKQPRFTHDVSTYHVTIKKLGAAKMYDEMDHVVNEVLSIPSFGSEVLYNTMIYFFTEARKLSRAVNVYKHMRSIGKLDCRPSIRTYNLLFAALYHQMGVVYDCRPNSFTFDYLIHGLCSQGRTCNARKICDEMKAKGFVPSSKSYNSLVSSLALEGALDQAVSYLRELTENERSADYITYWTLLDESCRQQRHGDAISLLTEWEEKRFVDRDTCRKLQYELEMNYGNLYDQIGPPRYVL
ncbi:Pentatricopeptide repeat-containing protein [Cynara cardunculus var. scolymus]|uniref:Pentatricopeptide repeat-containing protein n=1 Tax=Cynara cardunculus var. scolymus TaxID=59895 RepID=A0A103YHV5_CYNCS|nr:Pentatricopeptide repeat-containing protein [Cynara cardunculus var. scolymus]